jgi:glutamate N-acetyltransferase / amino-acid N-acetyltransferase
MTPGPGISKTPLPKGFLAGGINSGVRKYRPDLGLIISETDAVCAGVFTANQCKAAPVLFSQAILPSRYVRAIVTNSGQANAATGLEGRDRNWRMALATAQAVGCAPHQVVTASTGVIGVPLEIEKIVEALPKLVDRSGYTAEGFAVAILTTDLVPKTAYAEVALSGGNVLITGISKGSGMIHPNMATMLGYVLTDARIAEPLAQALLRECADVSFNMISVDGDTSTNDCSFLMANGASGVDVSTNEDIAIFKAAMKRICITLAQAIARDGEGATKLIEVQVDRSPSMALARRAARGITLSPLVKSAIHGADPNWGRILARFGSEGIPAEALQRLSLRIQDHKVFENGMPSLFDRALVRQALKTDFVRIHADFDSGENTATAWGCDLTSKYVEINTEYS